MSNLYCYKLRTFLITGNQLFNLRFNFFLDFGGEDFSFKKFGVGHSAQDFFSKRDFSSARAFSARDLRSGFFMYITLIMAV